jgi:ABC-type branched-subunit amino acid transport system permease subunit
MRSPALKKGIRTGAIFGVVIVVMFFIGFTITGAGLIGKLFGASSSYGTPSLGFFFLFLGLIGIWAGIAASPRPLVEAEDTFQRAILAGTAAGFVSGLFAAAIGFVFGTLNANKIDPRTYLPSVSPESIRMFLFNQSPLTGSLMLLGMLTVSGLAGAALAFFLRTNNRLKSGAHRASNAVGDTIQSQRFANIAQNRYVRLGLLLLLAILLIVLPRTWGSYWNYVFGTVGIYILLGLGLNIITGWSGQLVLGYVAFFAIGAYTFALLTAPEPHHLMWNFWIALGLAVLAAAIVGLLLGLPILNLRGDYLAIVTLGFAEIIRILLKSDLMTNYTAGPRGIRDIAGPSLIGKSFTSDVDFMYLIIIAVLVVTFLASRLKNSRTGKGWLAINLDETVARATGINAFSAKLLALALAAGIAGLAGALFASRNQFTGPDDHALMVSINVLCLLIVGGIGSIPGIFLGAFILKGLPEILRETENFRLLIFGVLLIVMMRLRPEGFLPARRPQLEKATVQESTEKDGAS